MLTNTHIHTQTHRYTKEHENLQQTEFLKCYRSLPKVTNELAEKNKTKGNKTFAAVFFFVLPFPTTVNTLPLKQNMDLDLMWSNGC